MSALLTANGEQVLVGGGGAVQSRLHIRVRLAGTVRAGPAVLVFATVLHIFSLDLERNYFRCFFLTVALLPRTCCMVQAAMDILFVWHLLHL